MAPARVPATRRASRRAGERAVWANLRALVHDRNDRRREACEAVGMSFVRVKALGRVAAAPMLMRDLGAALGVDAPYTTVVVDELERRGYVERVASPDDRRAKIVRITPAGRAAARKAEAVLNDPPDALGALTDDELATLARLIEQLLGGSR